MSTMGATLELVSYTSKIEEEDGLLNADQNFRAGTIISHQYVAVVNSIQDTIASYIFPGV